MNRPGLLIVISIAAVIVLVCCNSCGAVIVPTLVPTTTPTPAPTDTPTPTSVAVQSDPLLGAACCLNQHEATNILGLSPLALNTNDRGLWVDGRRTEFLRGDNGSCRLNSFYRLNGTPHRPEQFNRLVLRHTGLVYIVGNEPDLEWFEGLPPEEYARWFQEVRRYILALDATAMFCSAGIADDDKLASYLEALRALPERDWPDYVGIHCYAFGHSEPDVEDFLRRLDMQVAVCQTTLPRSTIWLTEFGWLGGTEATEAQGLAFMRLAVAEIRARPIIRRAAWWPTKYRGYGELATWLSLIDPETQELTVLGREYSRLARRR